MMKHTKKQASRTALAKHTARRQAREAQKARITALQKELAEARKIK